MLLGKGNRRIECTGSKSNPVIVTLKVHKLGAKNSIHKAGTKRSIEALKRNLMKGS